MFGRRAFSVAGLAAWNSLYQTTCEIRHVPLTVRRDLKLRPYGAVQICLLLLLLLKLSFSRFTGVHSALEALLLYKSTIDVCVLCVCVCVCEA